MEETQLKAAFAAFLLDSKTTLEAALKLYPAEKDRGYACQISFEWPNDPFVIVELERIKKDGKGKKNIPTKEEVIEQLWLLSMNERVAPKDRVTSARTVAEMLNYIPKPTDSNEQVKRMPSSPVYKIVNE